MDMSVSPDLEAFYCYGLVLLLGLAAASAQVSKRLRNLAGSWIMFNTWLLFFAYTLVPVVLFWFLDRTNAVHDTSLFAAILVGVGYQQILSGGIGAIRAPGEVSKFWQPFDAWANSIASRIGDRIIVHNSRFDEKLLSSITSDAGKLDALKEVALTRTADAAKLDQSLRDLAGKKDLLGEKGVIAKQATLLYQNLKQSSPEQFEYLLYKHQVIPPKWYHWYAQEWRSKTTALIVAIVLIIAAIVAVRSLGTAENYAKYYVWRLHKDNATDYDRFRSRKKLAGYVTTTSDVYPQLTGVLRIPNLPAKSADDILGLLVEARQSAIASHVNLQALLAESLRVDNSDIRARIHKVLLYLADEKGAQVPQDLRAWQSDPKNTATDIDQIVKKWMQVK
jgi:hypothetical protein